MDWGRRITVDYGRNRVSLSAGGLAYFVALSLAPAALAFGTLAGVFLDPDQVRDVLERFAAQTPEAAGALQTVIDALVGTIESASATSFTITTLVSLLIAVYAAAKVVLGVRMAMNTVFGVTEKRSGLIERGVSTVITLIGMVAAVAIVVVLTILPQILDWLGVDGLSAALDQWWLDWPVAVLLLYFGSRWVLRHAPSTSGGPAMGVPGCPRVDGGIRRGHGGSGHLRPVLDQPRRGHPHLRHRDRHPAVALSVLRRAPVGSDHRGGRPQDENHFGGPATSPVRKAAPAPAIPMSKALGPRREDREHEGAGPHDHAGDAANATRPPADEPLVVAGSASGLRAGVWPGCAGGCPVVALISRRSRSMSSSAI